MKIFTTTLTLALGATAVHAQEVTYLSYGAGYEDTFAIGSQVTVVTIDGAIEYSINQFYLFADIDAFALTEDHGGKADARNFSARAGYQFAPGTIAYVGLSQIDTNSASGPETIVKIGGQYDFGVGSIGLTYTMVPDADVEVIELTAGYEINPQIEVGFQYGSNLTSDYDTFLLFGSYDAGALSLEGSAETILDNDYLVANVNGAYDFGNNFRATGGITYADFGSDDLTVLSVGGGYEVADNMWIDAEYSSMFSGGVNEDGFGLYFSVATGNRILVEDRAADIRSAGYHDLGYPFTLIDTIGSVALFTP